MYLREFLHKIPNYKVVIEDDDKAAYAYLLNNGAIVSDVWLYNVAPGSTIPGWETDEEMPFVNPIEYSLPFTPPLSESEMVIVEWKTDKHESVVAAIYLRNELHALLKEGMEPGWCRCARKDGPLAKTFEGRDSSLAI